MINAEGSSGRTLKSIYWLKRYYTVYVGNLRAIRYVLANDVVCTSLSLVLATPTNNRRCGKEAFFR